MSAKVLKKAKLGLADQGFFCSKTETKDGKNIDVTKKPANSGSGKNAKSSSGGTGGDVDLLEQLLQDYGDKLDKMTEELRKAEGEAEKHLGDLEQKKNQLQNQEQKYFSEK